MAKQQDIGRLGEDIAVKYLNNKGYSIICRNYWKKWGEIDVVATKCGILSFVEVKSVSRESDDDSKYVGFGPEEHMNHDKRKRLRRIIETYLLENSIESEWKVDLMLVYLYPQTKTAKVDYMENIEL